MSLTALFHWQIRLKETSTAATSIPMKPVSAVVNAPMLTVAKSGGNYGTDDVRRKVCQP